MVVVVVKWQGVVVMISHCRRSGGGDVMAMMSLLLLSLWCMWGCGDDDEMSSSLSWP